MGKFIKHSTHKFTLAAVLGAALVATPAMAQPPENHGQSPHGGQAPAHPGGGAAPAAQGGAPHGNGGGAPAQQARPAQQAAPAQQAQRPQQNFGGGNNAQRGSGQGRPEGRPQGGQPGGPQGGRPGEQRGFEGQRGPGGPGFNGNGNPNAQRGPNWGPGASGQPRYNPGPQRQVFDEHRGPGPGGNYRAWNNQWRGDNRYDWRGWRDSHRDAYHLGQYNAPYRGYAYRRLSAGFVLDPLFYGNSYTIYDPASYRLPEAYAPYRWVRYYNDAILVDTYTGQVVDTLYGFFW